MQKDLSAIRARFDRLPRAQLGFFPTPLVRLENLSRKLNIDLTIKRDDFSGMSLFGGNKVRKLEFLLGQARAVGATHAITYGATQSNHAMETAWACRRLGIEPILYLTQVVSPAEAHPRANLLLDRILGAEVHIVPIEPGETEEEAEARSFEMGARRAAELNEQGLCCVDIPMGGANALGSVGFAAAMVELAGQRDAPFDRIYHATGTGGTMAGLHAGRRLLGLDTRIISVAVSEKQEEAYLGKIEALSQEVLGLLGGGDGPGRAEMHLRLDQWQPGYEQPSEAANEAIRLLARTEGLFVDPVYTGKAFAALLEDVARGDLHPGESVLFWHTGGATALFAEPEILGSLVKSR